MNKSHTLLLFLLLGFFSGQVVSLSCFCGGFPCEVPQCCDSGRYVLDACGCCPVCAKAPGDSCGGPFRSSGTCNVGLSCLRTCECKAEQSGREVDCKLPFKYRGKTYETCTRDNSENGQPWCATEVGRNGVAVNGRWADCVDGCPGTEYACNEQDLFNFDGRCVNSNYANEYTNILPYKFEEGANQRDAEYAPTCNNDSPSKCQCASIGEGQTQGGKNGGCNDSADRNGSYGWCFLEYVQDPAQPANGCFPDVQWSPTAGKFWSSKACESF